VSTSFDYEIELTVVIGKGGRYIEREDAVAHVAGYTIFNDGSIRLPLTWSLWPHA
jgi:2-keto-4-pentenoate hydratase/2-oxohepta-3-ene-1,7-dioic acid hydratase in catechol pathway